MEFARSDWFWLALLFPVLAWIVFWTRKRRVLGWETLGQPGRPWSDGGWAWVLALGVLILALAQPRWGRLAGSELPPGHDVVLLIDVSRSMAVEDAVPNRLQAAVESAEGLVRTLGQGEGNRAAVVAFAGRGVLRCPLTTNLGAVVETLQTLRPGEVRPGGSDLGLAIDAALDAFDTEERAEGRTIVLFSDGEVHNEIWENRLARLQRRRVILHAIALGDSEQGHPIPVPTRRGATETLRYLTYQGEVVRSQRDDEPLRNLSLGSGGAFVPLGLASADLGALYRERIAPIARQRRDAERTPERVERFQIFVFVALLIGVIGSWPGWRSRPIPRQWPKLSAVSIIMGAGLSIGAADRVETPPMAVAKGNALYQQGDLPQALKAFEQAIPLAPRNPIPRFNAGAVLYQLGRFGEAIERYREARELATEGLQIKIDFAIGNTSIALGDLASALRHYDLCIASTVNGPEYEAIRRDARINRQFAEQLAAKELEEVGGEPEGDAPGTEPDPSGGDSPSPGPTDRELESEDEDVPPQIRSSTVGGAGGTGSREPPPGTPESRLANALESIRDAKERRLPPPPPPAESGDRKDW